MNNPCDMPYKLPRRKKFRVLTGYTRMNGLTERLFFTDVWAGSADDALGQFDMVTTYCGEPIV